MATNRDGMNLADYFYDLPQELIAQKPLTDRAASRLMVIDRRAGTEHRHFSDIIQYINPGDVLVLNETCVIPARLIGNRESTGAKIELLLLRPMGDDRWEVLVKPGRRVKEAEYLSFGQGRLRAFVESRAEQGSRIVRFEYDGDFDNVLDELGEVPLPPYIHEKAPMQRYQTVYANQRGSVAAPTAGLHFTPELLSELENKGVVIAKVLLHVGLGTFRPVSVQDIQKHEMHSEYYKLDKTTAEKINSAKNNGGRIIAVGTTSVRVIESTADQNGRLHEGSGWTDIFIYPGYSFKAVDAMITNFHLPESTLLMLVSAFAGRERMLRQYREAVEQGYRFFSFGDAMLIK